MSHLIIGGDGFVGRALRRRLDLIHEPFQWTTRHHETVSDCAIYFDLCSSLVRSLPSAKYIYLVAAVSRFADCEGSAVAWHTNVDAPITIAKWFSRQYETRSIVFISSDAVERVGASAYGRAKAHVESFMHSIDGVIVRPTRITSESVDRFADFMIAKALEEDGSYVHRWAP